jgi:hypothetical protein
MQIIKKLIEAKVIFSPLVGGSRNTKMFTNAMMLMGKMTQTT